jgi:RNA polymerase sigma factor (sigma-70 family)
MPPTQFAAVVRHIHQLAGRDDTGPPDAHLLQRFRERRDELAFGAIVRRHGRMVLRVCRDVLHRREDAEDAFQATFLVLARSAASIREGASLSSWLYGVAYRVAHSARRDANKRQAHERRARQVARTRTDLDPALRELQEVLAEEVSRLPEKYRAPFVLCCLEGKSKPEAAAQLGWKEGTVSGRLARARERLRQRLTRRGLTLAAVLCAGAVAAGDALALSPPLVRTTIKAVLGAAPAPVAALAEGVTKAMFANKIKVATLLALLVGCLAAGAGALICRAVAAEPAAQAPAPPAAEKPWPEAPQAVEVSGRVLGPDDKPFAGAKLLVVHRGAKKEDLTVKATTGDDGRFRVAVAPADLDRQARLVATATDHGPDWIDLRQRKPADEVTLRLVKDDVPITGRVIDLEGKPVVGAAVSIAWLEQVDLKPWLADRTKGDLPGTKSIGNAILDGPASAKTDKDGRFRLTGIGRDRVAHVFIRGAGIEDNDVEVLARVGPVEGLRLAHRPVYATDAQFTVRPSKPIVGTVRDKKTGKPVSGIRVVCPSGTWNWHGATTDEKGQYRIEGVGKRKQYDVAAGGLPYFNASKFQIADTQGLDPLTVDFELERGVVVKGRLTDKATGKPVRGRVGYTVLTDNPNLKDFTTLGGLQISATDPGRTGDDGSFAVVCVPGPGLLTAAADDHDAYAPARLDGIKNVGNRILQDSNAVVQIDPSEKDAKSTACDIALEPARALSGRVVGPDGKPVAGAYAAGLHAVWIGDGPEKLATDAIRVHGLVPGRSRVVVFVYPEKQLAKVQPVAADEKEPLTVRLEATGALAGRVLDANGRPGAGLKVKATYRFQELEQARVEGKDFKALPVDLLFDYPSWDKIINREATTDKDGKFRLDGLVPGLKYDLAVSDGQEQELMRKESLSVEPGKTNDLGELKPAAGKGAKED